MTELETNVVKLINLIRQVRSCQELINSKTERIQFLAAELDTVEEEIYNIVSNRDSLNDKVSTLLRKLTLRG